MHKKAFTLIELMIVIAILGVLSALVSGNLLNSLKKGRDTQRKADLGNIQKALESYYEDKQTFPSFPLTAGQKMCENSVVTATSACPTTTPGIVGKTYMQKIPDDPIPGRDYEILITPAVSYQLHACMENTEQILPYTSALSSALTCNTECYDSTQSNKITCIYGISSSNISP